MSEHTVNVIEITEIRNHPNADALDIIPVGGWQAVARKGQFSIGDKAIYIEPDYVVPTHRPEFAFLAKDNKTTHRLRAVKLRGAVSFGLLIPVPESLGDVNVGDNVMESLEIVRYEPQRGRGHQAQELSPDYWPKIINYKFDLENIQKFPDTFSDGETVIVTEKIHGSNARYLFIDGTFYIGSRNRWLKEDDTENIWARALAAHPGIRTFCEAFPGTILYGEVFGDGVQDMKYGRTHGGVNFAAFAALEARPIDVGEMPWKDRSFIEMAAGLYDFPVAPVVYAGPFSRLIVAGKAEEDSIVSWKKGELSEGVVIIPLRERLDEKGRRAALKLISNRYWMSNNG